MGPPLYADPRVLNFFFRTFGVFFSHAKKCLLAGINVVVEKPITMLISQSDATSVFSVLTFFNTSSI